ncbi:P-loop containing nucleoside triphosphate hydrolase protein [Dipodascopsis uninucleata]
MPPKINLNNMNSGGGASKSAIKKAKSSSSSSTPSIVSSPTGGNPSSSTVPQVQEIQIESLIARPAIGLASSNTLAAIVHPAVLRAHKLTAGSFVLLTTNQNKAIEVPVHIVVSEISRTDVILISTTVKRLLGIYYGMHINISEKKPIIRDLTRVVVSGPAESLPKLVMPGMTLENEVRVLDVNAPSCRSPVSSLASDMQSISISIDSGSRSSSNKILDYIGKASLKTAIVVADADTTALSRLQNLPVIGYAAMAGLDQEIEQVRRAIHLPLDKPEVFTRFNVVPSRGILLHGPAGTGKSSLLKAIAEESENCHILRIEPAAILGRYQGDTESALAAVFEEAREFAPSIILIDELDALAPRRDADATTDSDARIISALVSQIDNLPNRVVVCAATTRLQAVDSSLRRPGRLEKEIELRIPDAPARLAILSLLLHSVPTTLTDLDRSNLAGKTHGYVGADLVAVVREAVMTALTREQDPQTLIFADFEAAIRNVRPSAMREIFLDTPKVAWTDIGGQLEVKRLLRQAVQWPLEHPETFSRLGISPPKGILLYGPPGCSKTMTAKALATEAGLNFLAVKGPEIFNKYVGESERAIRDIFRKARNAAPSIIFFDEFESVSVTRSSSADASSVSDRILTSLLNELDGIEVLGNVLVLAATNRPEIIDPALLRPGRFDRMIYVSPPNYQDRLEIFKVRFRSMAVAEDVDPIWLAKATDGCSGADIVALCQDAGLAAMSESVTSDAVYKRHFDAALKSLSRSITPEMLSFYSDFSASRRSSPV